MCFTKEANYKYLEINIQKMRPVEGRKSSLKVTLSSTLILELVESPLSFIKILFISD